MNCRVKSRRDDEPQVRFAVVDLLLHDIGGIDLGNGEGHVRTCDLLHRLGQIRRIDAGVGQVDTQGRLILDQHDIVEDAQSEGDQNCDENARVANGITEVPPEDRQNTPNRHAPHPLVRHEYTDEDGDAQSPC